MKDARSGIATLKKGVHAHLDLGLKDEDVLQMYRTMVLTRTLDERIWMLNRQGKAAIVASCQGH